MSVLKAIVSPATNVKRSDVVAYYTSRAQDAAQKIKEARIGVENADAAYRQGGSLDALNAANRTLADANQYLYECDGGVVHDKR
jgi:hypothetical protein